MSRAASSSEAILLRSCENLTSSLGAYRYGQSVWSGRTIRQACGSTRLDLEPNIDRGAALRRDFSPTRPAISTNSQSVSNIFGAFSKSPMRTIFAALRRIGHAFQLDGRRAAFAKVEKLLSECDARNSSVLLTIARSGMSTARSGRLGRAAEQPSASRRTAASKGRVRSSIEAAPDSDELSQRRSASSKSGAARLPKHDADSRRRSPAKQIARLRRVACVGRRNRCRRRAGSRRTSASAGRSSRLRKGRSASR